MGAYLMQLSQMSDKAHNPCESLKKMNLSKVKKLHSAFKNLCESFTINFTEYSIIFAETEASFSIWDSDSNGLIDALELFVGITLYSDSRIEDKLKFIFDLFDFNEIGSLSIEDMEYAIDCCVKSSCKMNGINPKSLNTEKVAEQVVSTIPTEGRITFASALKWCANDKLATQLFTTLDQTE